MINLMPAFLPPLLGSCLKMHMDHLNLLSGLDKQTYPLMEMAERHSFENIRGRIIWICSGGIHYVSTGWLFTLFLTTVIEGLPCTACPSGQRADGKYSASSMLGHWWQPSAWRSRSMRKSLGEDSLPVVGWGPKKQNWYHFQGWEI